MAETIKVLDAAARLGCADETVRDGIRKGILPGVAIPVGEKTRFLIPSGGFELFMATGIPTNILAAKIVSADCPEQALAMLRKALGV